MFRGNCAQLITIFFYFCGTKNVIYATIYTRRDKLEIG